MSHERFTAAVAMMAAAGGVAAMEATDADAYTPAGSAIVQQYNNYPQPALLSGRLALNASDLLGIAKTPATESSGTSSNTAVEAKVTYSNWDYDTDPLFKGGYSNDNQLRDDILGTRGEECQDEMGLSSKERSEVAAGLRADKETSVHEPFGTKAKVMCFGSVGLPGIERNTQFKGFYDAENYPNGFNGEKLNLNFEVNESEVTQTSNGQTTEIIKETFEHFVPIFPGKCVNMYYDIRSFTTKIIKKIIPSGSTGNTGTTSATGPTGPTGNTQQLTISMENMPTEGSFAGENAHPLEFCAKAEAEVNGANIPTNPAEVVFTDEDGNTPSATFADPNGDPSSYCADVPAPDSPEAEDQVYASLTVNGQHVSASSNPFPWMDPSTGFSTLERL